MSHCNTQVLRLDAVGKMLAILPWCIQFVYLTIAEKWEIMLKNGENSTLYTILILFACLLRYMSYLLCLVNMLDVLLVFVV